MYKAQQLVQKERFVLVEKETPTIIPNDNVLVKVEVAGICGSDLEYYEQGYCGSFIPQGNLVLGHEFSGKINRVGNNITEFSVGDNVIINPAMPCGSCDYCKKGDNNFCLNMKFFGSASCFPHIDGGFGEYVLVPAKNCLSFDISNISWGEAALVEPLMVALSAVSKINYIPDKDIAVWGGGTIGQLIVTVLQSFGAKTTSLIDIRKEACVFAERRGTDKTYLPQEIKEEKFDVCIDASGSASAVRQCYECANKKGTIIQVGTINKDILLPVNLVMIKELEIKGSFRYKNVFETAVRILEKKKVNIKEIITHTISLENITEGFKILLNPHINTLKVQVKI